MFKALMKYVCVITITTLTVTLFYAGAALYYTQIKGVQVVFPEQANQYALAIAESGNAAKGDIFSRALHDKGGRK